MSDANRSVAGRTLCGSCSSPMRTYEEHVCDGCGRLSLHDVHDAHAFVQATITRSGLSLTSEQREELSSEGLRALLRMAREYQPGRGGRDAANSRFSGYAAQFLPGKIADAWHRHERHRLATDDSGSRFWEVTVKPASLDRIAEDGNLDMIKTLQRDDHWEPEVVTELPALLADWWDERCTLVVRYGQMRSEGYKLRDFANEVGISINRAKEIEQFTVWCVNKLKGMTSEMASAA